jgi:hypothetical protein
MLILVPALYLLFRLTLRGQLDRPFEPIGAGDER